MKMKKRLLSFLLSLALVLGLVPGMSLTAYANEPAVTYIKEDGSSTTCNNYTVVTNNTTSWTGGWYVVNDNVEVADQITFTDDIHLILCDNKTLTAKKGILIHKVIKGVFTSTHRVRAITKVC